MFHNLSEQLLLLSMNVVFCVAACNNAEYEINGECCPICDPGNRVYRHCDKLTNTTCHSCLNKTFTNAPNGFIECLPCSVCDQSNGLRVKKTCTLISDTACEPLPGYYCIESLSNCKNIHPAQLDNTSAETEQKSETRSARTVLLGHIQTGLSANGIQTVRLLVRKRSRKERVRLTLSAVIKHVLIH
ncbi:tumor necrosis factor receptor superfamily member 14-like [Puntigrus tetrazona]|uniref:tumor necrosis factor receptor superfamily member 14-like n=1 Tax=Puntigrus tetrazona TaxID=1606681 RepID=UPI001C88E564|nr:tumor necrosis factor receptor superfamily member 14-like [Puntigrus tetrazona]XP_043090331.1 tumor necrosis factor receptor superfamily member 14-like [Puntigrus tetrazona]